MNTSPRTITDGEIGGHALSRISRAEQWLTIRVAVGFLGQKDQTKWWDTAFLSPIGQKYLAVNFPRTTIAASITCTNEAARRFHDERIGKGRVFHAFRLPQDLEEKILQRLQNQPLDQIAAAQSNRESAIQQLTAFAKDASVPSEGPVNVGSVKSITSSTAVQKVAAAYLVAFRDRKQILPYFSDNR